MYFKKKLLDIYIITKNIGAKLLYIKSGSTGHTFKAMTNPNDEENSLNFAIKIVAYPKKENYGTMYNIKRPENAELLMLKILSAFVINKQTPHIILPIATFNIKISPFVDKSVSNMISNEKYNKFVERYNKGEFNETASVLISEWANGGDLLDYIRNNYETMSVKVWKVLFFQIILTLAVIQSRYPSFRHNDLKANNILIHHTKDTGKLYKYTINGIIYIIPSINLDVKIIDFDFSCIRDVVENNKVNAEWTNKINISSSSNRYYDIHYFLNTLCSKGFFPKFLEKGVIPEQIQEFVRRVVPDKYSSKNKNNNLTDRGRLLTNEEYTTPEKILRYDKLFEKFRIA